jgi:hypothetical protein
MASHIREKSTAPRKSVSFADDTHDNRTEGQFIAPLERHPRVMPSTIPHDIPLSLHNYSTTLLTSALQTHDDPNGELTDPDTHRRLALGTKVMARARATMDLGRGNVDGNNPQYPEAVARTNLAYDQLNFVPPSYSSKAAVSEMTRAGNCDFHAATGALHAVRGMAENDVAAVVVQDRHTFAELRPHLVDPHNPLNMQNRVDPHDVVADSWATGEHAVLRKDSAMGKDIDNPLKPLTVHATNYTEHLIAKTAQGQMDAEHLAISGYLQGHGIAQRADANGLAWRNRIPVPGDTGTQYPLSETRIMDTSPATRTATTALNLHIKATQESHVGLEHGYMRSLHAVQLLGGTVEHTVPRTVVRQSPPDSHSPPIKR